MVIDIAEVKYHLDKTLRREEKYKKKLVKVRDETKIRGDFNKHKYDNKNY